MGVGEGYLGGIVQQAGRGMMGAPATLVIGPSIGPCCFIVGEEVAEAFGRRYGADVVLRGRTGDEPLRVDLWEAVTRAASELGVQRMHVVNPRLCTVCNKDLFYSYRADGPLPADMDAWVGSSGNMNEQVEVLKGRLSEVQRHIERPRREADGRTGLGCWWPRSTSK